ncbi:hypothetical protein VPNG_05355 [Cytospora leucostoma]|uniref:FAD-binding PCMH-type domain-containing protein n=1 Tax=Cytospora leucostoma TaxID=1230097 RepID=A0A423X4Y1_9PEZI|nr:hypothetical protein VPNG_05355 [Cytospora leucostoma]
MATLESLKWALRQKATATASSPKQSLSDTQYSAGFELLLQGSGWLAYKDFIIPQLSQLLDSLFESRSGIPAPEVGSDSRSKLSVLEIGPGPKSILGFLPRCQRQKVRKYTAFEPNGLFATRLDEGLRSTSMVESPLPRLESPPDIHRAPFVLGDNMSSGAGMGLDHGDEKYDVIIFCHSMYGMKPKHRYIERALEMLERPQGGLVVVFHRDGVLRLDGLVCQRTASFPAGIVSVADDDEMLDCFSRFIVGFVPRDDATRFEWRKVCRALGRREEADPGHLVFSSPDLMVAFTQHATVLPELTAQVPTAKGDRPIKNREARQHRPASIVRPTEMQHVQQCVQWARKYGFSLTVLGGGHSGHCLRPNIVSVDMSAFDQVHILQGKSLVVAEAGCKAGDIIRKTMAAGLTVPLGARPSVGAGLWLQGGIGHLARLHGLACDAIIGAVLVSVESSEVLCVGNVPIQYQPAGSLRPANEFDLLWAMRGAGTNFGILVSVTFNAYAARTYLVRNWVISLQHNHDARTMLSDYDNEVARKLPMECSADAYLYWEAGQMLLGVTMIESSTTMPALATHTPSPLDSIFGPERNSKVVDGVGLFETEMYVSGMHGGHGGGKTTSFKRCLFLKDIDSVQVADSLVTAIGTRPSQLCYLHLLHGGGQVGQVAADATAFGCRDWDFACVITGVWPRDLDGTDAARSAIRWVYNVAGDLLPLSSGVYGADLGPDPRDAALATRAFGPNWRRLANLKKDLDPHHILAYTCPLPSPYAGQKLIILVTGKHGAGKDYCADVWASVFNTYTHTGLMARVVSISDATKQEYAAATGADLSRLRSDRGYKEQHRAALTAFFQEQVRRRPRLPEEHFQKMLYGAADLDVLLITGMREEAPLSALSHLVSHLVPESRLLDVRVQTSEQTRRVRRGFGDDNQGNNDSEDGRPVLAALDYCPSLIFDNDRTGNGAAKMFAEQHLLPLLHKDLQRLADMVRIVPDFPRPGVEFRHVLGISQQQDGLELCTSLLQSHFTGIWAKVDKLACCETGGFVFASALAFRVGVPLVLIREAGKLPPPTVSVSKHSSYISSLAAQKSDQKIEMGQNEVRSGMSMVVVDDVFSTGETLCAVLQLLTGAGIGVEDVSVLVVAEFPVHPLPMSRVPPVISRVCGESRRVAFETGMLLEHGHGPWEHGPAELGNQVRTQWFDRARDAVVHLDHSTQTDVDLMRMSDMNNPIQLLRDTVPLTAGSGLFGRLGKERVVMVNALDGERVGQFRDLWEKYGSAPSVATDNDFKAIAETRLLNGRYTIQEWVEEIKTRWVRDSWYDRVGWW